MNDAILSGVSVLDLTSVIFGPFCTALLAAMGANVVKLEPPQGDEARRVGRPATTRGMGPLHMTLNAGKSSVTWNIKTPAGRAALLAKAKTSDVFIHNLRPDAAERAGLSYAALATLQPRLIYVSCCGFGSNGPYTGRAAYDDVIQSLSGATDLLPLADDNPAPRFLPMAIADKVAGLYACNAVLAALTHRYRTGKGCEIEVPMFECFTHFLLQEHLYGETLIPNREPIGYPRQLDPARHPLPTRDGFITVAPYTDARWVTFFEVTGHAEFLEQNELVDAASRFAGLNLMQAKMAMILRGRKTSEWINLLNKHDIPCAPVHRLKDVLNDPHLRATEFFRERTHPTEGGWRDMALPIRFKGFAEVERRPAPLLGEQNEE